MTEFKLPELGENIDQGDLVRLMISPGATISQGQAVMELETDKAVVEVPSTVSGVVKEIRVKEGEKIKVGQVIFTFENGAGAKSRPTEPKVQQAAASASAATSTMQLLRSADQPASAPHRLQPLQRQTGELRDRLPAPVQPSSSFPNLERTSPRAISSGS